MSGPKSHKSNFFRQFKCVVYTIGHAFLVSLIEEGMATKHSMHNQGHQSLYSKRGNTKCPQLEYTKVIYTLVLYLDPREAGVIWISQALCTTDRTVVRHRVLRRAIMPAICLWFIAPVFIYAP